MEIVYFPLGWTLLSPNIHRRWWSLKSRSGKSRHCKAVASVAGQVCLSVVMPLPPASDFTSLRCAVGLDPAAVALVRDGGLKAVDTLWVLLRIVPPRLKAVFCDNIVVEVGHPARCNLAGGHLHVRCIP